MGWILYPPNWHSGTSWKPMNLAASVTVDVLEDAALGRTSGACVRASTSQAGGSVAIDFSWPTQAVIINGSTGVFTPQMLTMATLVRCRPGQTLTAELAFWDLTQGLHDTVPFTATDSWQSVSLSAAILEPTDSYRLETYLQTPNVDLLLDRTTVA